MMYLNLLSFTQYRVQRILLKVYHEDIWELITEEMRVLTKVESKGCNWDT